MFACFTIFPHSNGYVLDPLLSSVHKLMAARMELQLQQLSAVFIEQINANVHFQHQMSTNRKHWNKNSLFSSEVVLENSQVLLLRRIIREGITHVLLRYITHSLLNFALSYNSLRDRREAFVNSLFYLFSVCVSVGYV